MEYKSPIEAVVMKGLHFHTVVGTQISVVELATWPLKGHSRSCDLDTVAKFYHSLLQDQQKSFVDDRDAAGAGDVNTTKTDNQLRFDAVVRLIELRQEKIQSQKAAAERAEEIRMLTALLEEKDAEALQRKSRKSLQDRLDKLKSQ